MRSFESFKFPCCWRRPLGRSAAPQRSFGGEMVLERVVPDWFLLISLAVKWWRGRDRCCSCVLCKHAAVNTLAYFPANEASTLSWFCCLGSGFVLGENGTSGLGLFFFLIFLYSDLVWVRQLPRQIFRTAPGWGRRQRLQRALRCSVGSGCSWLDEAACLDLFRFPQSYA